MERFHSATEVPLRWHGAVTFAGVVLACWTLLAWMALDMGSPLAMLVMPASADWAPANTIAIFAMWAIMMAAMMLPSAWPMVRTFVAVASCNGEIARVRAFVAAYVLAWSGFSAIATAAQWALQRVDWVNPMIVSTSAPLTVAMLVVAGVYQFSPLKRICLTRCRTPVGFLLGNWRSGVRGGWIMGLQHGLYCTGCCWALMALLFVGGAMNLPWVVALSLVVAIEKLAPNGDRVAVVLGGVLIAAGAGKLATLLV